jgi:hypothetical protein
MTVAASPLGVQRAGQAETGNPALNPQTFDRGRELLGAAERGGMNAAGAYAQIW